MFGEGEGIPGSGAQMNRSVQRSSIITMSSGPALSGFSACGERLLDCCFMDTFVLTSTRRETL